MTDHNEAMRLADELDHLDYDDSRRVAAFLREQAVARAMDTFGHNVMAGRAQLQMVRLESRLQSLTAERDQLRAEVERLRAEVSCGNGCACSLQCGDYYAHHGQENPSGNQNTIKSVEGLVRCCPTKDIVCGDLPANWCEACPNQNRIKKAELIRRLDSSIAWLERGEGLPGHSACIGLDDIKAIKRLLQRGA